VSQAGGSHRNSANGGPLATPLTAHRSQQQQQQGAGSGGSDDASVSYADSDAGEERDTEAGAVSVRQSVAVFIQSFSLRLGQQPGTGAAADVGRRSARLGSEPLGAGLVPSQLPNAGFSLQPRDIAASALDVKMAYEDGDAPYYSLRTVDYAKTKVKATGSTSLYTLVAADMFAFETKQLHVARLVNLPSPLARAPGSGPGPSASVYPPLLVVNLQFPTYSPSLFGATDGRGWSVVCYFSLPPDFDEATCPNPKALALFRRFVADAKEADGKKTCDRFKVVPRVVNMAEWAAKAPLSATELNLFSTYNMKPVLSRPQHTFFIGPNSSYMEIDFDIHTYSYIARSALHSLAPKLGSLLWELAFVIQGNTPDELPEMVLGSARIYRTDFEDLRMYPTLGPPSGKKHKS
jgi:hypothetical protein